jgi:sterol desaturase/sphingolipid hydroxylase (fatty acid hydroxylase superfamily)
MFRNGFLERLTHVHPLTPHVLYDPLLVALIVLAARNGLGLATNLALFAAGLGLWTFLEYTLHRFVFHFKPHSPWQQTLYFMIHGVHHDYPKDSKRLVMPPVVTLLLLPPFYVLYETLFGAPQHIVIFAGTLLGYLVYDTIHFAVHHFQPRTKVGFHLRQNHMRHHYLDPSKNFGVTSPLWDLIFGTLQRSVAGDPTESPKRDYALLSR